MAEAAVKSPCVAVCVLDHNDICQGCYRSAEEITDWFMADDDRKREILRACAQRRDELNPIRLG